ncbi:hypothetical protein ACFOD4_14775 [Pseudoroseomonas globiformis]|uniref:Uncharacterized protein n=1 Tax=Teichococcus globiformis TaxID=2307229 RepID=A0ABV7G0Z1_9PROT
MIRSRPVEIGGRFVGVAIAVIPAAPDLALAWRFHATEPMAAAAEGELHENLAGLQRRVQAALQKPTRRAA